ncbi:MAG: hypothetical protein OEL79_01360 [Chromatiales bacterium]|nr:hypothetical protein [Chromatiales bacterium]
MRCFIKISGLLFITLLLSSCAGPNELSKEEIIIQQNATDALTQILFENDLDENASFEVEKNGFVNLRIQGLVAIKTYTHAIDELRAHKDIHGVRAEQGGIEICPLTIIVR